MFIVFEGVDNSGKSTLSKRFVEYLNSAEARIFLIDHGVEEPEKYLWTKEPQFTTEEADQLNSGDIDEYDREAIFLEDRLRHQKELERPNIVCDRYIWSGLAYAKKFSPKTFDFIKKVYTKETLFKQPDLHIYVDTDASVCFSRDESVGLGRLMSLKSSYRDTASVCVDHSKILYSGANGDIEESLNNLIDKFKRWVEDRYIDSLKKEQFSSASVVADSTAPAKFKSRVGTGNADEFIGRDQGAEVVYRSGDNPVRPSVVLKGGGDKVEQ